MRFVKMGSEKIISLVENLIMSLILFGLLMVGLTSDASKTVALLVAVPVTVIYFCIMCSVEVSGFLNDVPNDTFRKHFYSNIRHDSDI